MYEYKPGKPKKSLIKVKKNNDPAPTSYDFAEAEYKTAKIPYPIKNTVPKAKNANYISK